MKEINTNKKLRVIRLFLQGLAYDDIVRQEGIAKGSVVNIINELRDGKISVPSDMAEYTDTLRKIAVDLRKNDITIVQAKSCLRIHTKLRQMGVQLDQTEQSIEICQGIASSSITNNAFVKAALELAGLVSQSGVDYKGLLEEYNAKLNSLKTIEDQIRQDKDELKRIHLEKDKSNSKLLVVTQQIATAKESFRKQKTALKSKQARYLAEHKLTWETIKVVEAALNSSFYKADLSEVEIEKTRQQIVALGSLTKIVKLLEEKRNQLQAEVDDLVIYRQHYHQEVAKLAYDREQLEIYVIRKGKEKDGLDTELQSTSQRIENNIKDLYICNLILDFLLAPNALDQKDFDRLVNMMIALRQIRLGIGPKQVTDAEGQVICRCELAHLSTDPKSYKINTDEVREMFAFYLAPLFRGQLVSKMEYDLMKLENRNLNAIIKTWELLAQKA